jgi:predicted CXXCH cytochrome family protein
VKTPAGAAGGAARGELPLPGVRHSSANRATKEHGIRRRPPIWTAIAALTLGLALQGLGCATPEERHRLLTIFFDGVPPLYPEEPEPLPEGPDEGNVPPVVRSRAISRIASVHGPVAEKECDQCHSSRYSNKLKVEKEELCWTCHDREDFAGAVVHGPFAAGFCEACHDPHRSKYEYLLVSDETDLCESCHEQYDVAAIPEHSSDEDRLCQSCHDPHAAARKFMLKADEDSS